MKIKVRKFLEDAILPKRATNGSAGYDLFAAADAQFENNMVSYATGIGMEIPEGYVGLIFPRSSVYKLDVRLSNAVGVIDSDYRGPIGFKFDYLKEFISLAPAVYQKGERIGQLVVVKYEELDFEEVDNLSSTDRGENGFGSTGK